MDGLSENVCAAAEAFERIENDRETAVAASRRVIRCSKKVIHAIHVGSDPVQFETEMDDALDDMLSAETPEVLLSGPVQDAMAEYAEAAIFSAVIGSRAVPSASDLGISASAWVLGLADCIGELRRAVTTDLMDGDLEGARSLFDAMEEIYSEVMMLDVPDAIAPVRRKQDIARGIMDRTRSDMTTAMVMGRQN